jgi:hypothetical protein
VGQRRFYRLGMMPLRHSAVRRGWRGRHNATAVIIVVDQERCLPLHAENDVLANAVLTVLGLVR